MRSEILDRHPSARLKILAVWFDMLPGDSRQFLDTSVLGDQRVTYFWDEGKLVGRWFSDHVTNRRGITWDAYFLYGPGATWDQQPGPPVSSDAPVIGASGQLEAAIKPLLTG